MPEQQVVDFDSLKYENGLFLFNEQPFTGCAVQPCPEGSPWREIPFVNGTERGVVRSGHRNGRLEETPCVRGAKHGIEREWFENGSLKSESLVEFGCLMRKEARNEQQEVIEHYERAASDPMYSKIIAWRNAEKAG